MLPETYSDEAMPNRDDPPPGPGEIVIRKSWDWPENVAVRREWWPDVLAPRRRRFPVERCHHCGEHPAATAPWRPNHPIFALLCTSCRSLVYNFAFRISERRGGDIRAPLDGLMVVMALLDA